MQYVKVVVDSNADQTDMLYTYASEDEVKKGAKVLVPFGLYNRSCDAYVAEVLEKAPEDFPIEKIKKLKQAKNDFSLSEEAMDTALWMHKRCLCRYIEAVSCFLPSKTEHKRKSKNPFEDISVIPDAPKKRTKEQEEVLEKIIKALELQKNENFLLFGVTGSGKTEVYLQAMEKVLQMEKQGIVLVPEISLTPQTVSRFMNRFGKEKVAVLHSKLTALQRDFEYQRIKKGEAKLVIGVRSAIFAPFQNIGLIVIDEEHENSYKSDKSPKYEAIEVAIKRAMSHKAIVLLGSATPSLADFYRAKIGIFTLLRLKKRYNENPLPEVLTVDMTKEVKAGNRSPFSRELAKEIKACLVEKKQVILFLNRRGYSNYISCRECGTVLECPECGISLTYHKDLASCICHYCGYSLPFPKTCPTCKGKILGLYGVGTQQVQEKALELFKEASIERIDLDTISKKGSMEAILKRFEKKKIDILIGTQLVAKGLDFDNVGLVGIISADVTLNIPDFRSGERSFQLITQAAGRAGRGSLRGKVLIQTYVPENKAVIFSAKQDYEAFYEYEINLRKMVQYPPFSYIFQILILDEEEAKAEDTSKNYYNWLKEKLNPQIPVLGPSVPGLLKFSGLFRRQILIKAPANKRREICDIVSELKQFHSKEKNTAKLLTIDINPYSFM